MARQLRIEFSGALYHVYTRGNNKQDIFTSDADRTMLLEIIAEVVTRFEWICHAYCLMGNHYHLLVETTLPNLSIGMKLLNGKYTQKFNLINDRVGHVFQGRFGATVIQKEAYLLQVARYVVLNPVYDRFVKLPEQWKWSSYRATAGLDKQHPCLTTKWILSVFSDDLKEAKKKYREFVIAGIKERKVTEFIKHQIVLGDEKFMKGLIGLIEGRQRQYFQNLESRIQRPALSEVFQKWDGRDVTVRDRLIISAHRQYKYTQNEISAYLGIGYSTVCRIVAKAK